MRRCYIVSGILLILSIVDFALAAPILVQEKRQASVDAVKLPKEVITVLGKRVGEDLEKLAEEFAKTWGKPIDSSDAHVSSSSAPPGPDRGSTDVVQAPAPGAPNPAPPTPNPGLLMEPSSPSSTAANPDSFQGLFDAAWDKSLNKGYSDKGSDTSLGSVSTPASTEYGFDSDPEWATEHEAKVNPIPIPGPSTGAYQYFDWEHWQNARPSSQPSSPNEFGLAPENQMGHVQQPNPGPLTGADPDFDWDYWANAPSPPKEIGLAPQHQMGHVQQPNAGPTGADPDFDWNRWMSEDDPLALAPRPLATSPQKEVGPLAAHQPPPYPLSSTELDKEHDVNQPLPYAPAATDFYSYSYPGSVAHPPVPPSAWLPKVPDSEVTPPSPGAGSPTVSEHKEVTPSSPGAGSLTVPEHEEATPPSPDLGSPKEPENEVVPGPPPTPELTDPEHTSNSDPQSLSTAVQPEDLRAAMYANEDLQASMYAAKGKGKESRSMAGTARDVGIAAQRELQATKRPLDPGE